MVFNRRKMQERRGKGAHRFVNAPIDNRDVTQAYKRWAKIYDISFGVIVRSVRHRLAACVNQECTGTLLDVGVGTGLLLPLFKRDLSVTGIDYSMDMLKIARRKVEEKKLTHVVGLEHMDASAMRFPDNTFDAVVCLHVMSVVPDPIRVLKEIERVCKPGGLIYIVNHFMCEEKGPRFYLEKFMAPASRLLGWHPDFSKQTLLSAATHTHLERTMDVGLFKLFTMMTFVKNN